MRSFLTKALTAVLLIVFLYSGWQLFQIFREYSRAEKQYADLKEYVSETDSSQDGAENEPPTVDFESLRQINPDITGWLTIEGTHIDYPVVQGDDNAFYLNHQFDGQLNSGGCLFLDAENDTDFQDLNQIIYGHHMKNESMFHDLEGYKQQDFYDAHPEGWLITPSAAYRVKFFSGYISDVSGDAWKTEFVGETEAEFGVKTGVESKPESGAESVPESQLEAGAEPGAESGAKPGAESGLESEPGMEPESQLEAGAESGTEPASKQETELASGAGEYSSWLESCRKKSLFVSDVIPDADSRILTLSTCSYEYSDARFVLHGILIPC